MSSLKKRTLGLSSTVHRKRYIELVKVLSKYGLDDLLVSKSGKKLPLVGKFTKRDPELSNKPLPIRMRLALEELGGAFIKIAQILCNRPDVIPEEFIIELEKLQEHVPPYDPDQFVYIIENELEDSHYNIFIM